MERLNVLKNKNLFRFLRVGLLVVFFYCSSGFSQVTPGASFLRTLPGARLQAMSGSVTAGLDVTHAFYANPGAAGFLREWQWGASYTKWIADVYNASFIFGKRVRTPWSQHARVALGVYYQGMGEFDSSDGVTPMATANDILISATLGQPLSFVSRWLSFGTNLKYFKSTLDQFNADAFIFDAGLFYRTPRFALPTAALGLFESGIFSAGISIVNVGSDLKYINSASPLPRALRGGIAFNAGTHNGLQTQLSLDYVQVRDEQGGLSFGAEVSWNRFFAIDAGYRQDQGLLDQMTLGLSLSLDDIRMPGGKLLPGRNKAVRLDLATLDDQEFFSRTYRGGLTHFSIGPEHLSILRKASMWKVIPLPLPGKKRKTRICTTRSSVIFC
ncbi:MAG: PorV/PorQ family protein [Calditrichaeota bacterium]|nr:PorV/PorQ family protein [Calditrichota bacterium]